MFDPWPFATVPDASRAQLWVGRPEKLRELDGLLRTWRRRKASDICVLWADFGQGKTHALLHIGGSLHTEDGTLYHYVQLPPLTSGSPFVALYRQVMRDFPLDVLARRVFEHYSHSIQQIFKAPAPSERIIHQLLWVIGTSGPGKDAAARWLRGDTVSAHEMSSITIADKRISVGPSPRTAQDCQNVLDSILRTAIDFPTEGAGEFVLAIDEFQRVGELGARKRTEVCDALHLLFNRHPQGFHMVLAFAGGLADIVSSVLTRDLQARVAKRIDLPPMSTSEGEAYLQGLVEIYSTDAYDGNNDVAHGSFPYEPAAVEAIVRLADPSDDSLSPRKINIAADLLTNGVLDDRLDQGSRVGPIREEEVLEVYARLAPHLDGSLSDSGT